MSTGCQKDRQKDRQKSRNRQTERQIEDGKTFQLSYQNKSCSDVRKKERHAGRQSD